MNVRKHDQLSSTLNNTIYGIINQGSTIKVKNSNCTDISISINLTNGFTSFIDTDFTFSSNPSSQIAIENSRYYTNIEQAEDDNNFNTNVFYPLYVQSGSLYNYPLQLEYATIDLIENNTFLPKNELQMPTISLANTNTKQEYSLSNRLENIGTGNEHYSTHYLTNGKYGYWGNAYTGEFISNAIISGFDVENFSNIINTIPRNLNGYQVNVVASSVVTKPIQIKNFFNGKLNVIFPGLTQPIDASDNNCNLHIIISNVDTNGFNLNNKLNDNQDITIELSSINNTQFNITGNNNKLTLINPTINNTTDSQFNIFSVDSYGNKVYIDKKNDDAFRSLSNNVRQRGNWIYVNGAERIGWLVNDSDSILDENKFHKRTINEIHPKKNRDCTDIGSIIGWPTDIPIPRGYYNCSLSAVENRTFAVDIHNHKDDFYNGLLAYYLNSDLSQTTFTIPYVPSAKPTAGYNSDPLIVGKTATYTPQQTTVGMFYIIKYNNNFENMITNLPAVEPVVVPTSIKTTVDINIVNSPSVTPSTSTSRKNLVYWFPNTNYKIPTGYLNAETNNSAAQGIASGTITWTINRVADEYNGVYKGYYQLSGLKNCLWSHNTVGIWGAQSYLYMDFTKAKINMETGKIENIVIACTRHHNNADGGGGGTAKWYTELDIASLTFDPKITTEQIIFDKTGIITPRPVQTWNTVSITVSKTKITIKAVGKCKNESGFNNRAWFEFWQSQISSAKAEYIVI